jgi:hypothetical protein
MISKLLDHTQVQTGSLNGLLFNEIPYMGYF